MYLAWHLGQPSPTRMVREGMSAVDWQLWQEYLSEHPMGERRDDLRMAMLMRATLLPHVRKGKKLKLEDFVLADKLVDLRPRKQTWQEQLAIVQAWALSAQIHPELEPIVEEPPKGRRIHPTILSFIGEEPEADETPAAPTRPSRAIAMGS